jgi:hypothetical protein
MAMQNKIIEMSFFINNSLSPESPAGSPACPEVHRPWEIPPLILSKPKEPSELSILTETPALSIFRLC